MRYLLCFLATLSFIPASSYAATTMTERVEQAAKSGKYTYVMFYRANDTSTRQMATTVQAQVAGTSEKTAWVAVNVSDPKEARLIKRFDASRIPLPAVFGLAPNGAVTGVFRQKVSQEQLKNAVLTPMYAEMVKGLQSQRIAVVTLMPSAASPAPAGVSALLRDPAFKGKLYSVKAYATDPAEADFFRRMKVDRSLQSPVILVFTPPGKFVGSFQATASGKDLAQKLHQSGKCNCEKCKHK